jgi:hypothetical protein
MPFFRPPPNVLDSYQLELCADAFRQAWAAIVRPGCHLPKEEETRLENEISDRLCFLAARGVIDPQTLQGLTVATVRLHQRPPLRGGRPRKTPSFVFEERHGRNATAVSGTEPIDFAIELVTDDRVRLIGKRRR